MKKFYSTFLTYFFQKNLVKNKGLTKFKKH